MIREEAQIGAVVSIGAYARTVVGFGYDRADWSRVVFLQSNYGDRIFAVPVERLDNYDLLSLPPRTAPFGWTA